MASISVRKLDEKTVAALRNRAARHGVSMEEEVRRILEAAAEGEESAGDMMLRIFSRSWDGAPFDPPERSEVAIPHGFNDVRDTAPAGK